jgi:hypothetical protein
MFSKTINESNSRSLISKSLKKISSSEFLFDNSLLLAENKNVFSDSFQKFLYLDIDDYHKKVILPIIARELIKAENRSAGSANIGLEIIQRVLPRYLGKGNILDTKKAKDEITSKSRLWIDHIKKNSFRSSIEDLEAFIKNEVRSEEAREIIKKSLKLVSLNSSIEVEKSKFRKTTIEIKDGYCFKIKNDKSFLFGKSKITKSNVNCYVIDGMVESVSEIHHLLSKAAEDKEPYVVFLRSLAPEVHKTIYINLQRGTINLIPVCVGFEENTINVLNDISLCTGCDLVSSLKGDLISTSVRRDPVKVRKIEISENEIIIHNQPSIEKIKSHVAYLNKKRDSFEEANAEIRDLFNLRIKSLTAEKLKITVGLDALQKNPGLLSEIDRFFRSFYSIINFGFFNYDEFHQDHIESFDQEIINLLTSESKTYPAAALCHGILTASSTMSSLLSIGTSVVSDI